MGAGPGTSVLGSFVSAAGAFGGPFMFAGPTRAGRDRTVGLVRRGYEFTRWLRPGTGPARLRLAGRGALLVAGPDGVRTFYETAELRRHRAVPLPIRGILFGPGAVHGLDGAEHRHRRAIFQRVITPAQVIRLVELADQEWDTPITGWQSAGTGIVFDTAVHVYGAAVQRWAGLPTISSRMSVEMARIVDGFGVPGPAMVRALLARARCHRWAR